MNSSGNLSFFPVFDELKEQDGFQHTRDDLYAGFTVAILAVPQCMAYAMIAGLHPVYGLYAGIVTAIVGGMFITARQVVIGPTAKVSLVVGGVLYGVREVETATAVALLGLMVGLIQIGFYLLNLGNLSRFVSESVVSGFIMGGAVVIVGDQILKLLGPKKVESPYFVVRAYRTLERLISDPALFHGPTMVLGFVTVLTLGGIRWYDDRLPGSLIVLVLTAFVSWYFGLKAYGVKQIGELPSLAPTLSIPAMPDFATVQSLLSGALALALLCSVQGLSIARSIASTTLQSIDENKEILGQGMANTVAALFTGFPVSASFSRSFLNHKLGAKTQLASIASGIFIGLLTVLFAPLLFYVPIPVLTGIVIVVVGEVIELDQPLSILTSTVPDRLGFLATGIGVLVLKLDIAIYLGVIVSFIFHIRRSTRLDLKEYIVNDNDKLEQIDTAEERIHEDIALIDVNGEAFFGAAKQIKEHVRTLCEHSDDLRVVILRMKNATNIDITAVATLRKLALELKEQERTLMLCGTTPAIRTVLKQAGVIDIIGEDKIMVAQRTLLESTRSAIERARRHIDEVLAGETERTEENIESDHTLEQLEEDQMDGQDPIQDEKHGPEDRQ